MNRKQLKDAAMKTLEGKWGLFIGITIFTNLIGAITEIPDRISRYQYPDIYEYWNADWTALDTWGIILSIVYIAIMPALLIGESRLYLNRSRNIDVKFSQLFYYFSYRYWRTFTTVVLFIVRLTLWTLLFVIPGIIKFYSYAMTFYIRVDDPDLYDTQVIAKSREMMEGQKWNLFKLHLSFFWWILLGILTFGIGFLWTIPYMRATQIQFYLALKEKEETELLQVS